MLEFGKRSRAEFQLTLQDVHFELNHSGTKSVVAASRSTTWIRLRIDEAVKKRGLVISYKANLASRNLRKRTYLTQNFPNESSGWLQQLKCDDLTLDCLVERQVKRHWLAYLVKVKAPGRRQPIEIARNRVWKTLLGTLPPTRANQVKSRHSYKWIADT